MPGMDLDEVVTLSMSWQCRVIYIWLPFEVDIWCRRLLAAPQCEVGLDIEWHVTFKAGAVLGIAPVVSCYDTLEATIGIASCCEEISANYLG